MTERSALDRAELLARMAPHPSVTVDVLAGRESQFPESRLVDGPPVTYLEDTEAPAYVLTNAKRGVAVGTKRNGTKPDDDRGTIVLVTGRRTLCLVGIQPGDEGFEIPHSAVQSVSVHSGFFASRLEIDTRGRTYHCWVGRGVEEALLEETAAYIEERTEAVPDEHEADDEQSDLTYRGESLARDPTADRSAAETADAATDGGDADVAETDADSQVTYRGQPVDSSYLE